MLIQAIGLSDSISEEYMYPIFLVEKHIKVMNNVCTNILNKLKSSNNL